MDMDQAKSRMLDALRMAEELGPPATAIYGKLGQIQQVINEVRGAGYQPNTMGPLMVFVNEVVTQDEHQRARYASLIAGIKRVSGAR